MAVGDLLCRGVRKVRAKLCDIHPRLLTFCSEHYIGYIPLEIYQNASSTEDKGIAGRLLVQMP